MAKDEFSGLRKAYAESKGISIRTAQRHQRQGHPDWQRFIGATAVAGVERKSREGVMLREESTALAQVSPLRQGDRPAFYDRSDSELSPAQIKEKQAWEMHWRTYEQWAEQQSSPGGMELSVVLVNQLPKLRENHEKAQQARVSWEIEQRMLIQRGEFEGFVGQFILPLAELLRNLPAELAPLVNPDNPAFAREKILGWLRDKCQPQINAMLTESREFVGNE